MAGSPFYARIKAHVLEIITSIPEGHVVAAADIGAWLDVPARHVAYILATLTPEEEARYPWFRVVSTKGAMQPLRTDSRGVSQRALLEQESVGVAASGRLLAFEAHRLGVEQLALSLPRQTRPPDAPTAPRRRRTPAPSR